MCFMWISQQASIVYLYGIKCVVVIIIKGDRVYCAVGTDSKCIVGINFRF
jgi:hypothetical protein